MKGSLDRAPGEVGIHSSPSYFYWANILKVMRRLWGIWHGELGRAELGMGETGQGDQETGGEEGFQGYVF
ncbi:MAG: hypothetical protein F6J93_12780 [Oscillatoria sp. SIO1A7]|nr:hypothetical protein [Oscillatoria sp. SIO1A7]